MSTQAILLMQQLTSATSAAAPHVVLRRELARRQSGVEVPPAAVAVEAAAPTAGVYAIRNRVTGRVYVSGDLDVEGVLEYDRLALQRKDHRNDALQAEWNWYGEENFTFKVIETIEPRLHSNARGKLGRLVDASREKLGAYGRYGYNTRVRVPF